jgi:cellulose synthase operon protein YhjQ
MEQVEGDLVDAHDAAVTPEDVAVLYSWANLHGAKYRDFSASRREYRAQMRHRAAEQQRESELRLKAEAEAAAAAAEKAAREAEEAARFHESAAREATRGPASQVEEAAGQRAKRAAAELARKASLERIEAARRAEAVAAAEAAARREEREMAEAHASALRQAQRYQESEIRRRDAAGPQPMKILGGQITDPYTVEPSSRPDRIFQLPIVPDDDMQPSRFRQRETRVIVPQVDPAHREVVREYYADGPLAREAEIAAAGGTAALAASTGPVRFYEPDPPAYADYRNAPVAPQHAQSLPVPAPRRPQGFRPDESSGIHPAYVEPGAEGEDVPQWIHSQHSASQHSTQPVAPLHDPPRARTSAPVHDSLQHSRERVASRWYALKGVFDHGAVPEPAQDVQPQRVKEVRAPMLTVFSLAGGVGKTSLVATLGRALSSIGEKVLLTDTTSHGLLPFYFGASELRPGVVRTFSPPAGSPDAPISLVSYDVVSRSGDSTAQDWLAEELAKNGRGVQRILLDLTPSAAWVARRLARMNSTVLVPVAPDMNSVISLQGVEKFFAGMVDGDGRAVQPYYLLNQFDASLPLHLDVREVMRQQLGDRLLPFVVRRSPSVSEALAEGMTVMDYAPEAPVAGDYMNLASWLRTQSAPAQAGFKNARWSER